MNPSEDGLNKKILLSSIKEVAGRKGFRVRVETEVEGKSGVKHPVDLVADGNEQIILMELRTSPTLVDEVSVSAFYAKCFDTSSKAVFVAMPALMSRAARLAEMYRMKVVEGRGLQEVVAQVERVLDELR